MKMETAWFSETFIIYIQVHAAFRSLPTLMYKKRYSYFYEAILKLYLLNIFEIKSSLKNVPLNVVNKWLEFMLLSLEVSDSVFVPEAAYSN
jgi:hypothetical protein